MSEDLTEEYPVTEVEEYVETYPIDRTEELRVFPSIAKKDVKIWVTKQLQRSYKFIKYYPHKPIPWFFRLLCTWQIGEPLRAMLQRSLTWKIEIPLRWFFIRAFPKDVITTVKDSDRVVLTKTVIWQIK